MHPRIIYTNEDFERIKSEAASGGLRKDVYDMVIANANATIKEEIPEFVSSGENLWIKDMGLKLPNLSAAYRLTGDKKYFDRALVMTEKLLSYPYWATNGSAEGEANELAASGAFVGISLFWDWCYDEIGAEKRAELLPRIIARAESMAGFDWYRATYLQNHLHQCAGSLLLTAAAIYDETDKAEAWISAVTEKFRHVMNLITPDGGASEGHMYYTASMNSLVMAGIVYEKLLNVNMLSGEVFENASAFAVYNTLSLDYANGKVDQFYFNDAPYYSRYEMGAFVSFLSHRFNDYGGKQYVKDCIAKKKQYSLTNSWDWMLLRYLDTEFATLPYEELEDYPVDYIFEDTGYAYLRESFKGDSDVMAIRCGAPFGAMAADKSNDYYWSLGVGHQHPDNGHFQIYSEGAWVFRDDGYTTGKTKSHNTVLVNGLGQYGDPDTRNELGIASDIWNKKWTASKPKILGCETFDGYSVLTADVTDAYPTEAGLTSFIRTYVYLKESKALVVFDKLSAAGEKEFAIRFRPAGQFIYNSNIETGKFRLSGKQAETPLYLDIKFVTDKESATYAAEPLPYGKGGEEYEYYIAQNKITAKETTHIAAFSWANRINGEKPAEISVVNNNGLYVITAGDKVATVALR